MKRISNFLSVAVLLLGTCAAVYAGEGAPIPWCSPSTCNGTCDDTLTHRPPPTSPTITSPAAPR